MKTYLKDPMQGMPQMGDMYSMPQIKGMQNMHPMMNGMQNMYPMMSGMQNMYPMMSGMMMYMQSMYQMMVIQSMYPMMSIQKTYPMMDMEGMNCMYGMPPMMGMDMQADTNMQFPIPMLVKLEQLSPNQIQISYDRDVDIMLGTKPTNHWIKDTMNVRPQGIATLGRNDDVNAGNSLNASLVKIEPKNGSARTFILTFNRVIPRGAAYMLIICYVTVKGAPPYSGDNGMISFIGK